MALQYGLNLNSNGEIIAVAGVGDTVKAGSTYLGTFPVDSQGRLIIAGLGGGGGSYTLPTASTTTLGGVRIDGTSITIASGVISAVVPVASTSVSGTVKVDGTTVTINGSGVISAVSSGGGSTIPAPSAVSASRSLTSADNGGTIYSTSATAITLTVPSGLGVGFGCAIAQNAAGQVSVVAGSGVTISNRNSFTKTAGQYAVVSLVQTSNNNYILVGDGAV